jgi:L-ascorbate metabolism protein UlaG (beta-lactamase superfamily)
MSAARSDLVNAVELAGRSATLERSLDLAVLPIGDLFTMGPDDALEAVKLLQPKRVVPSHFSTWPPIAQDAAKWAERVRAETKAEPVVLKPGGTINL